MCNCMRSVISFVVYFQKHSFLVVSIQKHCFLRLAFAGLPSDYVLFVYDHGVCYEAIQWHEFSSVQTLKLVVFNTGAC